MPACRLKWEPGTENCFYAKPHSLDHSFHAARRRIPSPLCAQGEQRRHPLDREHLRTGRLSGVDPARRLVLAAALRAGFQVHGGRAEQLDSFHRRGLCARHRWHLLLADHADHAAGMDFDPFLLVRDREPGEGILHLVSGAPDRHVGRLYGAGCLFVFCFLLCYVSVDLADVLLQMGPNDFVRIALPFFPDVVMHPKVRGWMIALSIIGIIYGALVSLMQKDMKKLVAYSSVSHLGFCTLGIFALNPAGLSGSVLQQINHGISTGALFLIVGILYERRHTREISEYGGISNVMPVYQIVQTVRPGYPGASPAVNAAVQPSPAASIQLASKSEKGKSK